MTIETEEARTCSFMDWAVETDPGRLGLLLLARSAAPAASSRKHPPVIGPR